MRTRLTGAGSKVALDVMPIDTVTLSDRYEPREGAQSRRIWAAVGVLDAPWRRECSATLTVSVSGLIGVIEGERDGLPVFLLRGVLRDDTVSVSVSGRPSP
jgi:hypothetical protein